MAGFTYRKQLNGSSQVPTLVYFIVNNSVTVSVGDCVQIDSNGHAVLGTTGEEVAGIVAQVVDKNGLAVTPDSGTNDTYTVDSDNETVDQVRVGIIMSKDALFYNDADASLAETNRMQFFNVNDENDIDVGSASDDNGQFQLIEIDPDNDGDASKGLFKIAESQLDPYSQD